MSECMPLVWFIIIVIVTDIDIDIINFLVVTELDLQVVLRLVSQRYDENADCNKINVHWYLVECRVHFKD